jgi:hypothetical protein
MSYKRKTYDTWQLWSNYGQGWEHETTELSRKDGKEQLKTYRENCPQYSFKLIKHREKVD